MNEGLARIKKRDGIVADFVQDKITTAVYKAMESKGLVDKTGGQEHL